MLGTTFSKHRTLNLPQPPRTDDVGYLAALREASDATRAFNPDAPLVLSLGFDTYHADPICNIALQTDDYARIGSAIVTLGCRSWPSRRAATRSTRWAPTRLLGAIHPRAIEQAPKRHE